MDKRCFYLRSLCCFGTSVLCLVAPVFLHGDSFPAVSGTIEIHPRVHASVELEYEGYVIQVDPWSINGMDDFTPADLILVTDNPGHHLDVAAIRQLSSAGTTVVMPANSRERFPQGTVVGIGEMLRVDGINIEAVATYDIIPGPPEHPRGDANGYVITLGGKRILFAGVTECVAEIQALQDIDLVFMPLNIPPRRMTPADAANCTKILDPEVVYTYHYDQGYARRQADPDYEAPLLPGDLTVAQSLERFAAELQGSGIEYRRGDWYPMP